MILRDYQESGINEIRAAFSARILRVCYVAPPGAGKGTMVAYMARTAAERGKRVLFLIHRRELLQQIQEDIGTPHQNIQLGMAQSIVRRLDTMTPPDLIISDEFHHGVANTWRKIFNCFSDAYLVGLTATPARTNGSGLSEICDKLIIGPDVKTLIERGFLAPFRYFAPPVQGVDLSGIRIKMGDYDQTAIAQMMDKPNITGQAIDHYRQLSDGKQAIIYCASIQHSQSTAAAFKAAWYSAQHVDGNTPDDERAQAIADFKAGKLKILCNVELFGEGLNVPGVEVVILLRPTQSLTLYVQQSMRSMRPWPGKTAIIIDAVGNCFRHGLPDEPREWNLTGTVRKRKSEAATISVRACMMCYAALPTGTHECPYCHYVFPVESRVLEEKSGELKELTAVEKKQKRMEVGMCRTIAELKAVAAARNYKPGWVWAMAKAKGIKA